MNIQRLVAIASIFILACFAWMTLGSAISHRTQNMSDNLRSQVSGIWGEPITQHAPVFMVGKEGEAPEMLAAESNRIEVTFDLEHRRKGLIWYPTYESVFDGSYALTNPSDADQDIEFRFTFPLQNATYDDVSFEIDGEPATTALDIKRGINQLITFSANETRSVRVAYKTRGLEEWRYLPGSSGRIQGLSMVMHTNFDAVDFPENALSPDANLAAAGGGRSITWEASDLLTSQAFAIIMPERLNPGPIATRVTFFAPVCLLFFFTLTLLIQVRYEVMIHPMHYLFVAAGFFAFHLAFAYLVDVLNIHVAFWIAAITSGGLVTLYMRGALGPGFPWRIAFGGQLIYLVLFSYSFFLKGITGLTIMIASIVTLALVMKLTVNTDWEEVFKRKPVHPPMPIPSAAPGTV